METPAPQAEPAKPEAIPTEPVAVASAPPTPLIEPEPVPAEPEGPEKAAPVPEQEVVPDLPAPVAASESDQVGMPLPRPRPERPDGSDVKTASVPLPDMPGPELQASRASTPATERQSPEQPTTPPVPATATSSTASRTAPPAPAQQSPAPSSAPAALAVSAAAEQAWQGRVVSHLYRRKQYPGQAQRERLEGTATLRFSIDTAGRVLSARIARSSGHAQLDSAAMALIERASPVPAPPAGLAADKLTLVVPIEFKLR